MFIIMVRVSHRPETWKPIKEMGRIYKTKTRRQAQMIVANYHTNHTTDIIEVKEGTNQ
jgi:hypothetical protein